MEDLDLEALAREFQASGLTELHVKTAGFELFLANDPAASIPGSNPAAPTTARPAAPATPPALAARPRAAAPSAIASPSRSASVPQDTPEGAIVVRAPYLGTFYRAPKPGEPNFAEIGDTVAPGADLCLVEVMKLFTAVRAETGGVVRQVLAADGQMVEEGQALFVLEPVA